ncbi:MAG: transposase [Candidatus Izemoplasmatales bacterium]|nr:transposase [bacterium]MDZ4197401.1 transposase [Candidatus Izemoplasmatales bacterium]
MFPIPRFSESLKKILGVNQKCKSVSIDDFAKKKRHTYGTVLIDSNTRKVIDILDSKKEDDVVEWLKNFPSIERISRDGSLMYARAISIALPNAIQISDRFHIMKNLTDRALKDLRKRIPLQIKIDERHIKIPIFTNKKKIFHDNLPSQAYLEKVEQMEKIQKRYFECRNYQKVAKEFRVDYRTVKQYVQGVWTPSMKRDSHHALAKHEDMILSHLHQGMKRTELFKILQSRFNYQGTYSSLRHFILKFHHQSQLCVTRKIQRRQIERLLFDKGIGDLGISLREQKDIIHLLRDRPEIQRLIDLVTAFRIIIGSKSKDKLDRWLLNHSINTYPEIMVFRDSVYRDYEAIVCGITEIESNGIAEGKINKIKTIKRMMYGRCSFELLRQKVLQIEYST